MINIVAAFTSKRFGIGNNGALPWHIPEDMAFFKELTQHSVVVMGRKTWESIPEHRRPLKDRINVVITRTPRASKNNNVVFMQEEELDGFLTTRIEPIFIIGGSFLFKRYVGTAHRIYATIIDKEFECDTFFPTKLFGAYEITQYSPPLHSKEAECSFRFVTYCLSPHDHGETPYLKTLRNIMEHGHERDDRTGTGTKSVFAPHMRFDISRSFPLLTTKFVGIKSVIKELLFFLRGQTDSKVLEGHGVNIWKANTTREFLDKRGLSGYEEGDMGPMYGFNWRHFGADYKGSHANYDGQGYDQLENLVKSLNEDPYSRRHMLTTYNPATVQDSVLAPCHGIVAQFYVQDIFNRKHLSCHMYQRSMDTFLGAPWNIASYAALTHILAIKCGMLPHELVISMGDAHVYKNHYQQVELQLSRQPLPLPILEVNINVKDKAFEDICVDDFNLVGYMHHPPIKADMAV